MFYNGDLRSGIALALKESKSVACFVKGDDDLSSLWENEYLQDNQVKVALESRAVTLRIHAGSQEAGFLAAYYPLPDVPAFMVIHNGQLILHLQSKEAKESFKAAVLKTLVVTPSGSAYQSTTRTTTVRKTETTTPQTPLLEPPTQSLASYNNSSDTPADQATVPLRTPTASNPSTSDDILSSASPSASSSGQSSQTVNNPLADQRRRLEICKQEEAAERAERKAKADALKASMIAHPDSAKAKQASYAQQQRKREQDARLDRERILKQIQQDKAERKEKEKQRKALAKAQATGNDGAGGLVDQQLSSEINRGTRCANAEECAIQVRLFDGGTIRSKFTSDTTLRKDVRVWADRERSDGDFPYALKQILNPLPNRTLSISEEEDTLQSLGFAPSATLVMVPIQGYAPAYSDNQGMLSRGAAAGYNAVAAGAGLATSALGTLLGLTQARVPAQEPVGREGATQLAAPGSEPMGVSSGINIRTLRDQQGNRDERQLYNGNQLNFEPRKDSEDKED